MLLYLILLVYQQIEDTILENDSLKIQLTQVIEEKNSLQQHGDFYANELSLLQSETSFNALLSPLQSSDQWETLSESAGSQHSNDSVNTSTSSIPVPSSRITRRFTINDGSKSPESERVVRKLRADLREVSNTAHVRLIIPYCFLGL
jgi:hypothetical protein